MTSAQLEHVTNYSFDPSILSGNVEQFLGVAQVPIGLAGPLLVNGEHAQGEFYVPMATAEGTLVASYNRGMRLLHESGGVKTTILDDRMQRAPAFVFPSAREAREFGNWLVENFDRIKDVAESTTRSGKLIEIEQYSASRILYTRFDYTTGDAAGQNLTGKATQAACHWIKANYPGIEHYFLESNFATDKKSSQVNMLHTRGKRVVAEAVITNDVIERVMRSNTELMFRGRRQRGGVVSRPRPCRAAAERRLLLLGHDPVADRRHLRRRHRPGDPARVSGDPRLLRRRPRPEVRRDRGRNGPLRRAFARFGHRRGGMGRRP
jgi:hydroxymethylglutaryl-CoA reductase (NADPH)